jgi:DNA-3-methyladenine glycosylase II
VQLETVETRIVPKAPYDFATNLRYLQTSPSAILEQVDACTYARVWTIHNLDVLMEVSADESSQSLRVTLTAFRLTPEVVTAAKEQVRRVFQLDTDPVGFYTACATDPVLAGFIRQNPGLRPVLFGDPYESLLWAILGQQVHVRVARGLKLALLERYGHRFFARDRELWVLPAPQTLAQVSPEDLRALGMSSVKAGAIVAVSDAIASGHLHLPALRELPYDEAARRLTAFRGIGRWTAEYVLMRGLGFPDVIPAADVGLQTVIGRAYGLGRKATEAEVRQFAERWAPWRSWAAYVWWYRLQTEL